MEGHLDSHRDKAHAIVREGDRTEFEQLRRRVETKAEKVEWKLNSCLQLDREEKARLFSEACNDMISGRNMEHILWEIPIRS